MVNKKINIHGTQNIADNIHSYLVSRNALSLSNSFSHLLTTLVANAFPKTFVMLRNISQKWSIGNNNAIPSIGILNIPTVAVITTNAARGTPAIPLLININTNNMVSWVPTSI